MDYTIYGKTSTKMEDNDLEGPQLCDSITLGMSVQAETKTGQRWMIRYLLFPISQTGRER